MNKTMTRKFNWIALSFSLIAISGFHLSYAQDNPNSAQAMQTEEGDSDGGSHGNGGYVFDEESPNGNSFQLYDYVEYGQSFDPTETDAYKDIIAPQLEKLYPKLSNAVKFIKYLFKEGGATWFFVDYKFKTPAVEASDPLNSNLVLTYEKVQAAATYPARNATQINKKIWNALTKAAQAYLLMHEMFWMAELSDDAFQYLSRDIDFTKLGPTTSGAKIRILTGLFLSPSFAAKDAFSIYKTILKNTAQLAESYRWENYLKSPYRIDDIDVDPKYLVSDKSPIATLALLDTLSQETDLNLAYLQKKEEQIQGARKCLETKVEDLQQYIVLDSFPRQNSTVDFLVMDPQPRSSEKKLKFGSYAIHLLLFRAAETASKKCENMTRFKDALIEVAYGDRVSSKIMILAVKDMTADEEAPTLRVTIPDRNIDIGFFSHGVNRIAEDSTTLTFTFIDPTSYPPPPPPPPAPVQTPTSKPFTGRAWKGFLYPAKNEARNDALKGCRLYLFENKYEEEYTCSAPTCSETLDDAWLCKTYIQKK